VSIPDEPLIVIAGPTGSGKSALAMELALRIGGEIVNYDSVQIYRGFDIGSAKPSAEDRARVPHHLIDVIDPDAEFHAADFARLARPAIDDIHSRGRRAILVGGTGFYLRALLSGLPEMPPRDEALRERISAIRDRKRGSLWLWRLLQRVDPITAKRVSPADRHRVERALEVYLSSGKPISTWTAPVAGSDIVAAQKFALRLERARLIERLERRVDAMYDDGLIEETRALLARWGGSCRPFSSIGYAEAASVIGGGINEKEAREETKRRTRAYAKRQMTWLRGEAHVTWLDASADIPSLVEEVVGRIAAGSQ
jgi:tRNA dimethylallyltransferase